MSEENKKETETPETEKQETSLSEEDLKQVSGGVLIGGESSDSKHKGE